MADYKFCIKMYQDASGDENARCTFKINDNVLLTNQEIVSSDVNAPELYYFTVTGLPEPDGSTAVDFSIKLENDHWEKDAQENVVSDRNVHVADIGYSYLHNGTDIIKKSNSTGVETVVPVEEHNQESSYSWMDRLLSGYWDIEEPTLSMVLWSRYTWVD